MYKISLPVSISNPRFEKYCPSFIDFCRRAGVGRVFLCAAQWTSPECEKQRVIELLKKYIPVFKAEGFEVGIWINSLGHGGTCGDFVHTDTGDGLTRMVSLDGVTNLGAYCPLCGNFRELAADWIRRLGTTGAELIMLDDDYRYAFRSGGIFCACEKHRRVFEQELGERFDPARMKRALTSGGPNRWRDVWLKVQGESLTDFAKMLRSALDEVAPQVRLSACAVLSTWDTDGVDSITLAKAFAGDTKPYLRLIGAPYWPALRNFNEVRLPAVCEYARLQQHWCEGSDVEIFNEGDCYPRPRYIVPAAYLEGYDQVMRAAGTSDGILKYMFDYVSAPEFETGYFEEHMDNAPIYEALTGFMALKPAVGVTVFEPMKTFALSRRPGNLPDDRCIPASLRFVTDNSLPVRYDSGEDATFVFGDAGEVAGEEQFAHGAVLDITAAEALTRRGFDVGLRAVNGRFEPNGEEFIHEGDVGGVTGGCWFDVDIAETAVVDSWQVYSEEGKSDVKKPAVYTYENAAGQRFAVYCFHAQESFEMKSAKGTFRSPYRAMQLRRLLPYLSGRKLDAVCDGAPDLYMMAKKDGDSMTVALWNMGPDKVKRPAVRLGGDWTSITCHIGKAALDGPAVNADTIPPFSVACFTLHK